MKIIFKYGKKLIDEYFSGNSNCDFGGEAIRESFRRLRESQTKINAEALCMAFQDSQKTIRQYLEENQFKLFLQSQFLRENYHRENQLPAIDEDQIATHRVCEYQFCVFTYNYLYFQLMPPPTHSSTLTAESLSRTQSDRAAQSGDVYYNPTKVYYAPYGSHNNSEYASQSSDTCTSDARSYTTDTTDTLSEDTRAQKRRQKVRIIGLYRNQLLLF